MSPPAKSRLAGKPDPGGALPRGRSPAEALRPPFQPVRARTLVSEVGSPVSAPGSGDLREEKSPNPRPRKGLEVPSSIPHHFPAFFTAPLPARFPSLSQRASEEPGTSDLSPAPIEKWVLVTTQITAFLVQLPTARCKGSPKGGGPVSQGRLREAELAQSSQARPAALPNFLI